MSDADPIPPVTADDAGAHSGDVVAQNVAALKALFPSIVIDGQVDLDLLRQLLGDEVEEGDERYGLNWKGKRRARAFALTPTMATLRPAKAESKDWDSTGNIVIEGDNLEVLKCLRRSYAGKVKLIYIDPPYNTGGDFVYPDDYADSLGNYERLTGQRGADGAAMTTNKEASGRFHTDWLNMMYPRLMLAKELLRDDGLLYCSIDASEGSNLMQLLEELFGKDNILGLMPTIMNLKGNNDAFAYGDTHEFTAIVCRDVNTATVGQLPVNDEATGDWEEDDYGYFKRADTLRRTGQDASRERRPKGWFPIFIDATEIVYASLNDEKRNQADEELWPVSDTGQELSWTWGRDKIIEEPYNLIVLRTGGRPNIYKKQRPGLSGVPSRKPKSTIYDPSYSSSGGSADLQVLFGVNVFDSPPKPRPLLRDFLSVATDDDGLVLDFFAGSGSMGHAVMQHNAIYGGNRRYILVQLPEPLDPANTAQKTAADFCDKIGVPRTIAELTKERLRRAGAKVAAENADKTIDTGFRVYKLATSNLKPWQPDPDNLAQSLLDAVDNILPNRTEDDLLVELLLKTGIDLTMPMQTRTVCQRPVHALGGGVLIVYLGDVSDADAEDIGQGIADWHAELDPIRKTTFYFRDTGFATAVAKANVAAIIRQRVGAQVEKLASV